MISFISIERYIIYGLSVPITDTVKISISVADISAVPIIGTPLIRLQLYIHA